MVFSFSSDFRHCLPFAVSAKRNTLFLYAVASTRRCGFSSLWISQDLSQSQLFWRVLRPCDTEGIPLHMPKGTSSLRSAEWI